MDDLGQAIRAGHGADDDIAAVSSVAAIRTTLGHVFLAPETTAARTAIAALYEYRYPIDKHDDLLGHLPS
jgi:hypothetical protein